MERCIFCQYLTIWVHHLGSSFGAMSAPKNRMLDIKSGHESGQLEREKIETHPSVATDINTFI